MTATSSFRLDGGEPFSYRDGVVHVGGLPVDQLAGAAGTPVYLYDLDEVAVAYRRGDLVAVLDTGAYGMVMASDYNGQPRPAEVVVAGSEALLSRQRRPGATCSPGSRTRARPLPIAAPPPTSQPGHQRPRGQ
jgi:hypothetical protein